MDLSIYFLYTFKFGLPPPPLKFSSNHQLVMDNLTSIWYKFFVSYLLYEFD